ncbi:hypothetical protein D1007_57167 [Hordeum vulgare]|nr:hypothetical protein D1007_57167 [Hordeum vulgare]
MEEDVALNVASRDPTSSSIVSHFFFMAKASKVSPTLNTNISVVVDDDDDDDKDDGNDEDSDNIASLKFKGEMSFRSLYKNKVACSNFMEIMSIATEGKKYIKELEVHLEDHEATIETMEGHERDYADEIAELSQALENEQTTKESLEETFPLEFSRLKESHDRALEVANDSITKNYKLEVADAKLHEDYEHLENGSRAIKSSLIELTESHAQLEASYAKELAKLPSPLHVNDDACPTNYLSCEASISNENVELRDQLELLSSNYGKLQDSHVILTSCYEDILVSHNVLKLAHEAITTKVREPHVDISTISSKNAILPCASPRNSSTHNVATSCDELLSMCCCSKNKAYTSSTTCVDTNHLEEIKELKAQATSLKKDLEKSHEGMSTLNNVLCGKKIPK